MIKIPDIPPPKSHTRHDRVHYLGGGISRGRLPNLCSHAPHKHPNRCSQGHTPPHSWLGSTESSIKYPRVTDVLSCPWLADSSRIPPPHSWLGSTESSIKYPSVTDVLSCPWLGDSSLQNPFKIWLTTMAESRENLVGYSGVFWGPPPP